jgi:hypothetical protein
MNYDRFYSHSTIFQLLVCCILWHSLQVGPTPFLYIKRARDSVNVCGWYIMEACFITIPVENHRQVITYKSHTVQLHAGDELVNFIRAGTTYPTI